MLRTSGSSLRVFASGLAVACTLIPARKAIALAQKPVCDDLHGMIVATYDFKPSELSEARKLSKSNDVDRIWDLVKAHPEELVPCLRKELERKDANRWFLHDGSDLLVRVDKSRESKSLQARIWSQDDLRDIDPKDWVETLARRGSENFDVSTAADRWLANLDSRRFRTEHGLDFEPKDVPVFLFGSMKESKALPALVRIVEDPEHRGRFEALKILFLLATDESFEQLRRMAGSHPSPDIRVSISSYFEDPPLLDPAAGDEGPDRQQVLAALASYLGPNPKLYFQTRRACEASWTTACASVLTAEDVWLVRKVRRHVVRYPGRSELRDYHDYSCLLLTLIWDSPRPR